MVKSRDRRFAPPSQEDSARPSRTGYDRSLTVAARLDATTHETRAGLKVGRYSAYHGSGAGRRGRMVYNARDLPRPAVRGAGRSELRKAGSGA